MHSEPRPKSGDIQATEIDRAKGKLLEKLKKTDKSGGRDTAVAQTGDRGKINQGCVITDIAPVAISL